MWETAHRNARMTSRTHFIYCLPTSETLTVENGEAVSRPRVCKNFWNVVMQVPRGGTRHNALLLTRKGQVSVEGLLDRRKSGGGNALSLTWKKNIVESICLGIAHSHYSNTDSGSKTVQLINGYFSKLDCYTESYLPTFESVVSKAVQAKRLHPRVECRLREARKISVPSNLVQVLLLRPREV